MIMNGISSTFSIINAEVFDGISQNMKQNRQNGGTRGQQSRGPYTSPRLGDTRAMRLPCIIMQKPSI